MKSLMRFSEYLYQKTNGKVMIIAIVIFFLFSATVFPWAANEQATETGTANMPDTLVFASPDTYYHMAESYGETGRSAYIGLRYTFDLAWPIVYGVALAAGLSVLLKTARRDWVRRLNLLPLFSVLFDLAENALAVCYMARWPMPTDWAVFLLPYVTLLKWASLGFAMILVLVLLGKRGIICIMKNTEANK